MTENSQFRALLAFDYGTRKIGVAVGQTLTATASPLPAIKADNGTPDWEAITRLIDEWKPDACIVGLPLNMDGSASELSARAEKFSRQLNGRYNLPAFTVDERLSSREARDISRSNAEMSGRKFDARKGVIHSKIQFPAAQAR
jgi:putative Holliday junction resolvase